MPKEEFNPRTFFALHDMNGDGVLDQEEVESLLSTEIKKLYDPNNPEDDPNEMQEEYHRMREHIYKEADKDHDGLISRKEFLDLTARPEFEKDDGWKTLDEQQVYTQDELREYEKHRQEALAHQYAYYMPQQYYPPNQFVPYDHVAVPHPQQPGQVAYVPVQQHPGFQQQQHPQAGMQMQQQHPGAGMPIQHQQQPSHVQYQQQPQAVPQMNQQMNQPHYAQPQVASQPQLAAQQPAISGQPIYTAHVGQQHPNQPPTGNVQPPPVGYQQPQMNALPNAQYSGQANAQPNFQPNVQYQQPASQQQPSQPKH